MLTTAGSVNTYKYKAPNMKLWSSFKNNFSHGCIRAQNKYAHAEIKFAIG